MPEDQVQLDGDPRTLARAISRAAQQAYRDKHGDVGEWDEVRAEIEDEVPKLAKQMVDALDREVRDVYLTNSLEVMALSYARRALKSSD